jgi:hypothetical protein
LVVGLFWFFWNGFPAEFLVPLKEERTVTALEGDALSLKTAKINRARRRSEGKEIGAAEQLMVVRIFLF